MKYKVCLIVTILKRRVFQMDSELKHIIDQIPKREERREISGLAELKERWITEKMFR